MPKNKNWRRPSLSQKILKATAIIILSGFFLFVIHRRLLEVEKARCEVWHWQVCQVLAEGR